MRVDVTMLVCACTVAGLKSARGRPGAAVHAKHAKHPGNSSCASCARVRARMRAHHGTLSFRLRQPGVLHRAVLAGPRRAAPRRPGWTDAAVAGLQTARGRPCAAAHCPLLDSPAVPGVLPRAVLAGPCALEASFVTVKTQRTQCSKKQKNRAGMYLYRKMTQQNRAGMYLYRKMTGHFSEIALGCICTEK